MKVKAYAIKEKGGKPEPFIYEKSLDKSDVLVRVTHCGMAKGDIQMIDNDWGDTKFPVVPGHEIIGIIEERGAEVSGLEEGDRVGIGYQQAACFECEYCKGGNEQFCLKQKVIGVDAYGGLADHIIIDGRFAFRLPPMLDSGASVPMMSSGLTVYAAITRAKLPDNTKVAVVGIGGLGYLAIRFLKKMGHEVSAFSRSTGKKKMINEMGAEYIDSDTNKPGTYNRHFDFILSTVNAGIDVDTYLKMLNPRGKLCFVAQPMEKTSISIGLLYDYAQRTIYGNYIGSRKDMVDLIAFLAEHDLKGIVDVIPFSKMDEAIESVRSGNFAKRLVLEK
jgi:D-arabinose 1-dehydrogenase-like Zn-dependent alcohol dehydrogenase